MLMPRNLDQENQSDNKFIIGKHGHASNTTVAAHTKMRLLSKVEQNMRQNQLNQSHPGHSQTGHINKLISTAATGNGLVGDVDELLTPMRNKAHMSLPNPRESEGSASSTSSTTSSNGVGAGNGGGSGSGSASLGGKDSFNYYSRPERNLWSRAEMLEMLSIMTRINALEQLNDRNVKSEHVFRQVEDEMYSKGYMKKSSVQIWTKWKFLKSTYNTSMRQGNGTPKVVPEEVYRVLCQMLQDNTVCKGKGGSAIKAAKSMASTKDSSSMVQTVTKTEVPDNTDGQVELGVEHPIFGFRLGLVKSEPIGYDSTMSQGNGSEQDSEAVDFVQNGDSYQDEAATLDHTPFIVTVKHEPEIDLGMDGTNTPPPTAPTSPSPPPMPRDSEDRTNLMGTLLPPLSTSTPMPTALRVAAFATDVQRQLPTRPAHGVLMIERPAVPPNKTAPSPGVAGKGSRMMPLHSTSNINFVHPTSKLMLPRKQLPVRLPREISVQPANTRPLKAVPMRDTGYSLRPDRMIPDLEQSISPPQSPSPPLHILPVPKNHIPYASTSRQAQMLSDHQQQQQQQQHQHQQLPNRKRRLNFSAQPPVPVKIQRSSTLYEPSPRIDDVSLPSLNEPRSKQIAEETLQRKQRQEELFKTELTQLTTAMRMAQKEMLETFFQQQKQLARREHEFQLRQDNLVMGALRKQTDVLLRTAQDLMQSGEDVEGSQYAAAVKRERKTNEGIISLVEPEIELNVARLPKNEEDDEVDGEEDDDDDEDEDGEDDDDDEAVNDRQLAGYKVENAQDSDDDNRSENPIEMSTLALSEDASNQESIAIDAQLS